MLSFVDNRLLRALSFHVLEIIKDGDSTSSLTNYLWNNSKENSDILTIKEIVWEKTSWHKQYQLHDGPVKLQRNLKNILLKHKLIGSFSLSRFVMKPFLHCPWEFKASRKWNLQPLNIFLFCQTLVTSQALRNRKLLSHISREFILVS